MEMSMQLCGCYYSYSPFTELYHRPATLQSVVKYYAIGQVFPILFCWYYTIIHNLCIRAVLLLFIRSHDILLFPVLTYEYAV